MSSVKKTPCNGCRERKRKCSYEQPCARCYKFQLDCVYTVMTSPADIEYLQELEYMKQIELMQNEISTMEKEIDRLKLNDHHYTAVNHRSSSRTTTTTTTEKSEYNYPSPISIQEDLMIPPPHRNKKQKKRKMIAKHNSIEAILSKEAEDDKDDRTKPWTLTVKNGKMSIETHIKSYDDLMIQFKGMISTCIYQESTTTKLPFPFSTITQQESTIGKACNIFIWKKYSKSRFKSLTKYTPLLLHYDAAVVNAEDHQPVEKMAKLTMRLIHTFFRCHHLRTISIHVPSFIRLFMVDEYHIMKSAAVMALCALICNQSCKHLMAILPLASLNEYGAFYFEKARELISEEFDQVSLESFMTFTFMSVYKVKIEDDVQAEKYVSMAERIYHLLLPQYNKSNEEEDDTFILFSRVYRCLYHVRSIIQLHQLMDQMFRRTSAMTGPRIFDLLESSNDMGFDMKIAKDDTETEIEFIKMKQYMFQLRGMIRESSQHIIANDLKSYISQFGHQVEMAMRHWYREVLPTQFQLVGLALFEDELSDIEFFMKLELECKKESSGVPLLITLSVYNEYLIMSKSYLPRKQYAGHILNVSPEELLEKYKAMKTCDGTIPQQQERSDHHWLKIIGRMRRFHATTTEESDKHELNEDESLKKLIEAMNPTQLEFSTLPLARTSVGTAFNMVRMVQFLMSREYACFLDLRWIMNVWEVLIRAARFKYEVDGEVTLDRIRANLILCLKIIQDQLLLSRRDSSSTFVDALQQEFNQLF